MKLWPVVLALLVGLSGCGNTVDFTGKTSDQMGAEIQKLEDKIQSVNMQKAANDALVATLTYRAKPSPSALLMEAPDIKNVLQGIATGKGNNPIGGVMLILNEPSVDQTGNKSQELAVVLGWNMGDLRKVNWDNISEWQILDLSTIMQIGPFGHEAISAYCKDSATSYGREFCRKAGYGQ